MPDTPALPARSRILDGIASIAGARRLKIEVMPPEARFALRLAAAEAGTLGTLAGLQFDVPVNRFSARDGRLAARLGPDEWLLVLPLADGEQFVREAGSGLARHHHALTDISDRHVAFELAGDGALGVLASGCPLDLERMAAGTVTRTLLGKAEIVLFRQGDAARPIWRVECWRSFGRYLHAFIAEAAREWADG